MFTKSLLASLLAGAIAPPTLEESLRDAEQVLVAEVVGLHSLGDPTADGEERAWPSEAFPVAELAVERMLLGAPTVERVFVVAAQVESETLAAPLAVGTRALFLLGRERRAQYRTSDLKNMLLRELTDGSPLFSLRFGGALELGADGQAHVPGGVELPEALSLGEQGLTEAELLTWVDTRLDEILPVLRGVHHTTGPFYWHCSVQQDGSWTCRTDETERFSQEQTDDFWRKVREARLHELPGNIGSSPGPDSSSRFLHLRSREGVVRVRFWNARPSDTPKEVALRRRVMGIWEALPGDGKP